MSQRPRRPSRHSSRDDVEEEQHDLRRGSPVQERRASRRAEHAPYPAPSYYPEDSTPSRSEASRHPRVQASTVAGPSSMASRPVAGPSSAPIEAVAPTDPGDQSYTDLNFRIVIVQQPLAGTPAGSNRRTVGQPPIVPAPVVQLIATDSDGRQVLEDFPLMVMTVSLLSEDGTTEVMGPDNSLALGGEMTANLQHLISLTGDDVDYFVFPLIRSRELGRYCLRFTLIEARDHSGILATAISEPFDVVPLDEYPLGGIETTMTTLSVSLSEQGIRMDLPLQGAAADVESAASGHAPPPPPPGTFIPPQPPRPGFQPSESAMDISRPGTSSTTRSRGSSSRSRSRRGSPRGRPPSRTG